MPAVRIFDELRQKVTKSKGLLPAEQRALFWFKDYATDLTRWQNRFRGANSFNKLNVNYDFTKQVVGANRAEPGFLYFYHYDPKLKLTLPYYDRFPFTLVIHKYEDGFLGLNFHYLDYNLRARFFDALYPLREGRASRPTVRDIRMRLRVTYGILKVTSKYKAYRPCIKRYLTKHIQSPLLKVGAREWDIALFLPVESFAKETKTYVWQESAKKIR